ncbi:hypothetical protein AeRB84_009170, partial [Aphanomyces euteiches]
MYFGLWNDLLISGTYGYSFLLNDPGNQRFTPPCRYSDYLTSPDDYSCDPCDLAWNPDAFNCYPNHELLLSFPDTPSFQLVHSNIGPLNSIDTYFIRAPPSLIQLHTTFRASVAQLVISNNMFAARMNAIPTLSSDPIPPSWLDPSFMYWMHHENYCIDPASAAINGILSVRFSTRLFLFDLKIWRLFAIE